MQLSLRWTHSSSRSLRTVEHTASTLTTHHGVGSVSDSRRKAVVISGDGVSRPTRNREIVTSELLSDRLLDAFIQELVVPLEVTIAKRFLARSEQLQILAGVLDAELNFAFLRI